MAIKVKEKEANPFDHGLANTNNCSEYILSSKYVSTRELITSRFPLRISTPQGEKFVGVIESLDGKRILRKKVRKSKHLLKILDSWGIAEEILSYDLDEVIVEDIEDKLIYSAPIETILQYGIRKDLGCGNQVFLKRRYWNQNQNQNENENENTQLMLGSESNEIK